jgi:AcrR family transcriptional regulator
MPKQVDATALRKDIREAARRVFARQGVQGTGLSHVAREAGMGRSSLYHYYPDKDALLGDLLAETLRDEAELFRVSLRGEGSTEERLHRLTDACVALLDTWAAAFRMMQDFRLSDASRFAGYFREIRDEFTSCLRAGQQAGEVAGSLDPEPAAATLIGAIDGLLLQHFLDPEALDPEALRGELRRIVTRVVAP